MITDDFERIIKKIGTAHNTDEAVQFCEMLCQQRINEKLKGCLDAGKAEELMEWIEKQQEDFDDDYEDIFESIKEKIISLMNEGKKISQPTLPDEVIQLLKRAKSFLPLYIPTKAHHEHNELGLDIIKCLEKYQNNNEGK